MTNDALMTVVHLEAHGAPFRVIKRASTEARSGIGSGAHHLNGH
jgi:hypothetical protein